MAETPPPLAAGLDGDAAVAALVGLGYDQERANYAVATAITAGQYPLRDHAVIAAPDRRTFAIYAVVPVPAPAGEPMVEIPAGRARQLRDQQAAAAIAAYARACLTAARPERDWFRRAVAMLEAAGKQIVQTEEPARPGGASLVLDWRTGQTLASSDGGQEANDAAWIDVSWIGSWMEDLATDGTPALDWPKALPAPPGITELTAVPPPLTLPGLPASLRARLEDTLDEWALAAGVIEGRAAEVAQLTGWTEDRVLACAGSYLTMTGEQYMRAGETAATAACAGPAGED